MKAAEYLGIEIGGTKLQLAIGRGEGEPFRASWRGVIDASQRAARIQEQIVGGVEELLAQAQITRKQIAGVAIGFGGPVDTHNGLIVTSHQVEGWENFPLVKWFEQNFGRPAVLHNDADTAAFAEAHFGAGRGFDPVLYVTVGSGIGGGLVCGGRIFRGSGAGAMEIGHLRPGPARRDVPPAEVTVESLASGFGIEGRARRVIAQWEESTVRGERDFAASATKPGPEAPPSDATARKIPERFSTLLKLVDGRRDEITTRIIAQAAVQGDQFCREILSDATETLRWALAQAVTLNNPARIVIGGGVSLIGDDLFFDPVRRACRANVFPQFVGIADIVPAALGEEVVIHGAVALARAAFGRQL